MSNQKFLPKKSYSLEDAAKYISLNHQINISVRDLLEYIQNGELNASVYLSGNKVNIDYVNRKEVNFIKNSDKYRELRPYYSECSLYFRLNPQKFEIQEHEDCSWLHKKDSFLDFYICLPKKSYSIESLRKTERLSIYDGNVGKVEAIDFEGYFQISGAELNSFNVDYLIDKGFLESFPKYMMAIYKDIICFLYIDKNKTPLYLDDICILHEHLIDFLKLFSVIDTGYAQIEEVQNLKNQLDFKDKQIDELKEQIESSRNIKVSTASENKKNEFIKALLQIKYGAAVAENPRPHVYDPNDSDKGKDGVIQKDFELSGLTKHLPSGKTLKNWVSSVELDN
ncbi:MULTISPECIES: hypothetical protein [Haemophilus]|uniref:SlyX protein n=1 Tax=Haemophilus parainfluenzae TaxID=729 RepID=A0AB37IMX9_HAEPA|nr:MULTISPECIES: hypothetical protein [Haemophilus]OFQ17823.1 hypothetical protein HMPREF2948_07185 [Haemophilus sp. HMSC073C03]RDE93673.1 SlyX protein [Haemophilus parainfluenzae]RDF07282.1 SlyX protein [Haemophilus parainfluenzae]DAS04454.1 MAG TPA: hypothetical protein [Caudoviricetes sp.]